MRHIAVDVNIILKALTDSKSKVLRDKDHVLKSTSDTWIVGNNNYNRNQVLAYINGEINAIDSTYLEISKLLG